jgi:hypothetical protein
MFEPSRFLPCPHDPFRPPDRRWRRCLYLLRHRHRPFIDHDDDATRAGWRYLREGRVCRNRRDHDRLAERHPAVAPAHHLYSREASLRRAEVEARLLARQSDEDVAAQCSLSAAAVRAYHDLFFQVRDALGAEYYIYHVVIGPKVHAGLGEDDTDILLKLLGYAHGPLMVDLALRYFRTPPALPARLDDLDAAASADVHLLLQLRQLIRTMVAPARARVGRKQRLRSEPTADRSVLCGDNEAADQSVATLFREQVRALTQAGLPSVLWDCGAGNPTRKRVSRCRRNDRCQARSS